MLHTLYFANFNNVLGIKRPAVLVGDMKFVSDIAGPHDTLGMMF